MWEDPLVRVFARYDDFECQGGYLRVDGRRVALDATERQALRARKGKLTNVRTSAARAPR